MGCLTEFYNSTIPEINIKKCQNSQDDQNFCEIEATDCYLGDDVSPKK
jgi:hypothetical protein